ncbi:MAG: NADH-quinone oxidoreductase subunit A [Halobaculum sp.]|jgi:NADH-quinone oxidoreductase subunit A
MTSWIAVGALAVVAVGIPLGMMLASWILRPSVPEQGKRTTYESGEIPTGTATGIQFNIQYYMVALLFVVFDIETVLIFPWVVIYRSALEAGVSLAAVLFPMLVFIGVLVVGLVWAWRQGAVKWASSPRANRRKTTGEQS